MGFVAKRIAAIAACGIFLGGAFAAESPYSGAAAEQGASAEAKVQRAPGTRGHAHPGRIRSSHVRSFALAAPTAAKAAAEMEPQRKGAPLKVGFGRALPGLDDATSAASALEWQRNPDGTLVAALSITSATAASVRAALRVEHLPANATVRFQAPGEANVFEVSGADIEDTLARNAESGDTSEAASLYWSPLFEGETLAIEIELAPGTDPLDVRVAVPHVGHLFTSAQKAFELVSLEKSAACEVDATCSVATWGNEMNAVARMLFAEGTSMFLCTGTLLADQDTTSAIPYFLSANHCINTQASASSLTTFWFYRSATCGGSTLGPSQQVSGGATLLYNSTTTDTSFMRLNATPPVGAVYAGWFAGATPAIASAATGLHHPGGDWLKISNGSLTGYINCTPPTNGSFTCSGTPTNPANTFYTVGWTSGITEPGSSGSGLFRASDHKLIGQLYGGSGTCAAPADDIYGRFDIAFNAALKGWLSGNTLTVTKAGSGSVASTPAGIDCGTTCSATFAAGTSVTLTPTPAAGWVFGSWSGACGGTGACVVPMSAAASVTATFVQGTIPLTITTTGSGTVTSAPAGINCGGTCNALYPLNSAVTLTATPSGGTVFLGWGDACTGTATCTVTMTGATSVAATFGAKAATTTTLASSLNPSGAGQAITLTATVAGGPTLPGGTVTFFTDGNFVPACASLAMAADATASCTTSSLAPGSRTLTASYSGDATHEASTSAPLAQSVVGAAATPASTLVNLSTRMQVGTGNNVLIAGIIIGGSAPKTVVVTAIGPSLAAAGIPNFLANPTLTLVRSLDNAIIATNDDWGSAPNAAQIQAAGFAPGNAAESAIMMTLAPGAYTAIVAGAGGGTGVGIVAAYEIDHPEVPLANASTRGLVLTGGDVMIGGFVIQGSTPKTVVVRASGPSLAPAGITNFLANPTLTLVRSSDGTIVATNDDWGTDANAAQLQALGLQPLDARESAILITLPPGAYTGIVSGVGGTTGVGTVEIFAP